MELAEIANLPYRDNVCAVVFKGEKFLLIQRKRWPDKWWQFPQGGVEDDESDEDAVRRELAEEVGLQDIQVIGKSEHTRKYDWGADTVEEIGFKWRGQHQKFFLVEFLGECGEVVLEPEFQKYKWAEQDELFKSIDHMDPDFAGYKSAVEKVLREFGIIY